MYTVTRTATSRAATPRAATPRAAVLAALAAAALAGPAAAAAQQAEMSEAQIVERALSAAPPQLRGEAAVVGPDGSLLKEGSSGFTCMLTPEVPTGSAPMCADGAWLPWAKAWVNGEPYRPSSMETIGLAYMLAGDTPHGGASNTDPDAERPSADNEWVVEGPHIMIIVPDERLVEHLPTDPDGGGPYVMWKGTPFAHVMMPTDVRPPQRQVAGD